MSSHTPHLFFFKLLGTPKFTMHPADLDLRVGSMAALSCSFNGYPAPSVIWRHDHEILLSEEHGKIMLCRTSSVLELNKFECDDEGSYITNCMGSDSTTTTLTLHGTYRLHHRHMIVPYPSKLLSIWYPHFCLFLNCISLSNTFSPSQISLTRPWGIHTGIKPHPFFSWGIHTRIKPHPFYFPLGHSHRN